MQLMYDTKSKCVRPCDEDNNFLDGITLEVIHSASGDIYRLRDKEYTEDEMFELYNSYLCDCGDEDYLIYRNDDDFFDMYPSRLQLVLDVSNNADYNAHDEYCTYERGIYLKSGELAECMDECAIKDMAHDIIKGVYNA